MPYRYASYVTLLFTNDALGNMNAGKQLAQSIASFKKVADFNETVFPIGINSVDIAQE